MEPPGHEAGFFISDYSDVMLGADHPGLFYCKF
jgi:hypothetical protein